MSYYLRDATVVLSDLGHAVDENKLGPWDYKQIVCR